MKVENILKRIGWTLLGLVGAVCVLVFCAVKYLESKNLAHIAENFAEKHLDGNVTIGSMRFGFYPGFPFMGVRIDSLTVTSHAFESLSVKEKGLLPIYADSLFSITHLKGAIDLKKILFSDEIALRDVSISGLAINLVIAHNGKANYEVIKTDKNHPHESTTKLSAFSINRFSLDNPKEIRFFNASDSTSASVLLLSEASLDGRNQPAYRLRINGNVTSPKATMLTNLDYINIGADGQIRWDPAQPGLIVMDKMEVIGEFVKAKVSGEIDFSKSPIIKKGNLKIEPLSIMDLMTMIPDSILNAHKLHPPHFFTDAKIEANFELTQPMDLTTDTIPSSLTTIAILPCTLQHGKSQLHNIALEASVKTMSNRPDSTLIHIKKFSAEGSGTDIYTTATISNPFYDPAFDAVVKGEIDITEIPPFLKERIPGFISGILSSNIHIGGSAGMLKKRQLFDIKADGYLKAKNFYYVAADTNKMVELDNARLDIKSGIKINGKDQSTINLSVDTATVLVSGINLTLSSLGLHLEPSSRRSLNVAKKSVIPDITGSLKTERFNIITVKDTAGANFHNLGGEIHLKTKEGEGFLPDITTYLTSTKVSAGTKKDKIIIDGAKISASIGKIISPTKKSSPINKSQVTNFEEYAYISPAEVHRYVYQKRLHGKKTKRVYLETGPNGDETLVWNLTRQFKGFLNNWKIMGSVVSGSAQLQSSHMPIHNEIQTIDIRFSNDTINIKDISINTDISDISMSGLITNVRHALTSKTDNTLKADIILASHKNIDINELSAGFIESKSNKDIGRKTKPILIPINVDASIRLKASRLSYANLDMKNAGGDILIYDGGINLHDFKANSKAGNISVTALYSAPRKNDIDLGFGIEAKDFNIGELVKLIPAIDSITPLMHDFSGIVSADIAATCRIDNSMDVNLPSLNAAVKISGDNLAFIDPEKYQILGKWLGFKNKTDNTIHSLNVELTVEDGLLRVYPFAFDIDRYRLGVYGSNNINMDFDYHLSVLKSPLPFRFGITIKGNPKKYKVRFGGAKFRENSVIESVNIVNNARINLIDQIDDVFRRGVRNSRFAKLRIDHSAGFAENPESSLTSADSLELIKEGILDSSYAKNQISLEKSKKKKKRFIFF